MQEQEQDAKTAQNGTRDELDGVLDAVLAKYAAAAEPREGLQERVLANLRMERGRVPQHAWWRWAFAVAAIAVAVAITYAWRPRPQGRPAVVQNSSPATPPPSISTAKEHGSAQRAEITTPKPRLRVARAAETANSAPKLDQFPSPQPLSEQEKLLASYVEVYPRQAAVLARLRTEELERERIEQRSKSASKDAADFDKE